MTVCAQPSDLTSPKRKSEPSSSAKIFFSKKASLAAFPPRIIEDKLQHIPSKGWAEMIRKVYEVDPLVCPHCGGTMKVIAFLTDYSVVDRIINHLSLSAAS